MNDRVRNAALLLGIAALGWATTAEAQIPVEKDRGVQTTSGGDVVTVTLVPADITILTVGDLDLYRGATDANIVSHILTGDSLEITMARLALAKSSNAAVREYAQMMIDHHMKNSNHFMAMQKDEDIGVTPMVNDPIAVADRAALAKLRNQTGADFDRTYIAAQVMHHDADASALMRMAEMARDDDLEQDIEEQLLPVVRQHLARARDLAAQVGVDVTMYTLTM